MERIEAFEQMLRMGYAWNGINLEHEVIAPSAERKIGRKYEEKKPSKV